MSAAHRPGCFSNARVARPYGRHWTLIAVPLASRAVPATADGGMAALVAVQRFLLAYSGVFALVMLTAAMVAGVIATDRLVITPAGRVTFQVLHRALSLSALGFLASHVLLEILAHRSRMVDTLVPFLASGRTVYLGLGTLAFDMVLLVALTGVTRGKFATHWTAAWRGIHVTAYLGWPLAIFHGLLSGRPAKPYVDWSYGGCVAAVALAVVVRLVAPRQGRPGALPCPVPSRAASVLPADAFSGHQPGARLPVRPPAHPALPENSHDGGPQYGTVHQSGPSPRHDVAYGTVDDGALRYGVVYGTVDDGTPRYGTVADGAWAGSGRSVDDE